MKWLGGERKEEVAKEPVIFRIVYFSDAATEVYAAETFRDGKWELIRFMDTPPWCPSADFLRRFLVEVGAVEWGNE